MYDLPIHYDYCLCPTPANQHIGFTRAGLCCLLMDVSAGATLTAVPLVSASPTYPKTLASMSFKFLLKCHLLWEAFTALLGATALALPAPGTPQAPRELGCSPSPREGALKVMSRSSDSVSKVAGVEVRCILEESLWPSYGENIGWGQKWVQDDSWEMITVV